MKRIALTVACSAVAFAVGVVSSDFVRSGGGYLGSEVNRRCIDRSVCVGDNVPDVFGRLDADKHGLTALFCPQLAMPDYLFLDAIVSGRICGSPNYDVELRSPTRRTVIEVRAGKIARITEGSLHTLDL